MKTSFFDLLNRHYYLVLSLSFGIICWVLVFILSVFVFGIDQSKEIYIVWFQFVAFTLFVVLGITTQYLTNKDRKNEDRIENYRQLHQGIRNVNQLLAYEKDKCTLIQNLCDILVRNIGFLSAWIFLFDRQGGIGPFAQSGLGTQADIVKEQLESGEIDPFSLRKDYNPMDSATDKGLIRQDHRQGLDDKTITLKLEMKDRVFGLLSVTPDLDFNNKDGQAKQLLHELAQDIALALYNLELEQKRQELNHDFWILAEHSPWGLSIMNPDRTFEYFNPKFTEIFGYNLQDLPDKESWFKKAYPDPDYRKQVISIWEDDHFRAEKKEKVKSRIFTIRCKDGTDKLIHLQTIASIKDKHFLSYNDITEQEQAKDRLKQSEEKFRRWFEASPDPVFLLDQDGVFIDVSPASLSKLGYSKEEIIGSSLQTCPFFSQESAQLIRQRFETRKQGYDIPPYYLTIVTKNGSRLIVEINVGIFKEKGSFAGEIVVARDVTERKEMEDKLRYLSFYDSLTGLYNRTLFEEEMKRLGDGRNSPLGVIVCDIDGLKLINDTLGHKQGDQILQVAAEILKDCFRESDIIARIGGDEFAVLLPKSGYQVINSSCDRIRKSIEQYNAQSPMLYLNMSIGYSVDITSNPLMHDLFSQADNNMYKEKIQNRPKTNENILQAIVTDMEARDFFYQGHGERVKRHALEMGRKLGLSKNRLNDLGLLARHHDLGKVGIPESIVYKPDKLTEDEFQTMKKHSEIGYRIAQSMPDLQNIAEYILKHHEWWNGQGYPSGLQGKDIPLESRIISIVDAFDIMTSNRPYHQLITKTEAIAELRTWSGVQFDPELVEQFVQILEEENIGDNKA